MDCSVYDILCRADPVLVMIALTGFRDRKISTAPTLLIVACMFYKALYNTRKRRQSVDNSGTDF